MSWIKWVPYAQSKGRLRKLYDRIKGPNNYIDNIMLAHSLRPNTLAGHMQIYKNVLHHTGNKLPKSLLETIGVYVSLLNGCDYCVEHHFQGLCRLLQDDKRAHAIRDALERKAFDGIFDQREVAMLQYAEHLTRSPADIDESKLVAMRQTGLTDGEILEVNQVVSYFAYANRTVLGLGISTKGDILGLSPNSSDQPDNWHHQ
ncbi:MAG: carboxymuconolactone decarboxylase family protein [Ardenticatenaceae bacterium]